MELDRGDQIIFMKVGIHAGETLESILERKRREIQEEGFSMWGYGGNVCHPSTRVQPFVQSAGGRVLLVMQEIRSNHFAVPDRASEYTANGVDYLPIPPGINVLGSKFALCIGSLDPVDLELNLAATEVPIGLSQGKRGDEYLRGHVDKACLSIVDNPAATAGDPGVHISVVAPLVAPYAVILRD
jgi:hypothetical protein